MLRYATLSIKNNNNNNNIQSFRKRVLVTGFASEGNIKHAHAINR